MAEQKPASRTGKAAGNHLAGQIKQINQIKQSDQMIQIGERNSKGSK